MTYAARVYLQSDDQTVMIFQMKKEKDCPEFFLDDVRSKTADRNDAEAIGKLVQAAIEGQLNS